MSLMSFPLLPKLVEYGAASEAAGEDFHAAELVERELVLDGGILT